MEDVRSILARFPERELDIRRRCGRDAYFRSICTDYEEASRAHNYWQNIAQEGDRKKEADRNVEEYANFLGELEMEILAHLNRSVSNAR
jgi:tRNA U55 pseudouridine synthase TruB